MFLGFALAGYRSFGKSPQRIGPLGKINFLAGANNSGKSNVLRFLVEHQTKIAGAIQGQRPYEISGLDIHEGLTNRNVIYGVAIDKSEAGIEHLVSLASRQDVQYQRYVRQALNTVLNSLSDGSSSLAWLEMQVDTNGAFAISHQCKNAAQQALSQNDWQMLWTGLTGSQRGSLQEWVTEVLKWLATRKALATQAKLVPALRQITELESGDGLNGAGLIARLAKLQSPNIKNQHDKVRFKNIEAFVRAVTRTKDAALEIPHEQNTIHVHLNGRNLPLSHLGTGIEQLVLFAALCTLEENQILCVEEPEIYLHPLFQRELIRYLATKTTNQYIIATHSAHFLNDPEAAVFRMRLQDGETHVVLAKTSIERLAICADLGYRASDLLQCNAVVWVEGPSDRIYILHWLKATAPQLVEGLHFSTMFYGGRLLKHLSATDSQVLEFISLKRLNQNMAIVIDSDKRKSSEGLNSTKLRVIEEIKQHGGFSWVTEGRQIENYVPAQTWKATIETVHPSQKLKKSWTRYQVPMTTDAYVDKVAVARTIAAGHPSLDVLDLRVQVERLAAFITAANRDDFLAN